MGLLSAVAGGALGAVGGTALDIWKMREGERLRWKYQEKYLQNVQTHDTNTREDTQAHQESMQDDAQAHTTGERVAGQDFHSGMEDVLHRNRLELQGKGFLFNATQAQADRIHDAAKQDDAQAHGLMMLKKGARLDRMHTSLKYGFEDSLLDKKQGHEKGLLGMRIGHERVENKRDRELRLDMQTYAQAFDLNRDEILHQNRLGELSHSFELRRRENRQTFRQERKLMEDRFKWDFKYWKKKNKWTQANPPEDVVTAFSYTPQEEKTLLEGFKEFVGIQDDSLASFGDLAAQPKVYARFNAYLRARIANGGAMPGVATWNRIANTMVLNKAQGISDDAAKVLDQSIYSMWVMDELASAPPTLFDPGKVIKVSQMTDDEIKAWNNRADLLRREEGLSRDEQTFAEEWRTRFGPSYSEYVRSVGDPNDVLPLAKWRKAVSQDRDYQTPPPNGIFLFKIARSDHATK